METEDALRLLLTSLFAIAPEAIVVVDREQRITQFNDAAENIFGYRRSEVLGQPLNLLLPERFRALHTREVNKFGNAPEATRRMSERMGIFGLHKDGHEFPAEAAICKLTLGENRVYSAILRDVTERKKNEAHKQLLMRELEHRLRNVLVRVQIVIQRSADGSGFREALLDRVKSMMRSYELLSRASWLGVTLSDLIADQLKPYDANHHSRIEGPEIVLNADTTQALSMVIHELTTNAVKYGALSVPEGHVTVSWRQEAAQGPRGQLVLQWREQGGPAVEPPKREGYGTNLIRELLTYELDGTVDQRYAPEGLTCQIALPLERVLEEPP